MRQRSRQTFASSSFFRVSVFASWINATSSLGIPPAMSFSRMSSKVLPAVLRALRALPPRHHLRVVDEILIDGKAVRVRSRVSPDTRVYPIGFDFNGSVPLLKKDNIRNDIRTGVGAERIVGQAVRAARTHLLQRLGVGQNMLFLRTAFCAYIVSLFKTFYSTTKGPELSSRTLCQWSETHFLKCAFHFTIR